MGGGKVSLGFIKLETTIFVVGSIVVAFSVVLCVLVVVVGGVVVVVVLVVLVVVGVVAVKENNRIKIPNQKRFFSTYKRITQR